MHMRRGFTLVELIVVIGIIIATSVVVLMSLFGRRSDADLIATSQQAATLLREAQSDAVAQEGDVAWGVYFSNATASAPFYALFSGGSYAMTTTVDNYPLPPTVAYQTSTLASGATTSIIFSPITGSASASTTIGFYMPKGSAAFSSTISVASSGEVNY
jgi:type II secretory pathway pseudopilin PulG